jgi:DNA-binding NtrC family response regulator
MKILALSRNLEYLAIVKDSLGDDINFVFADEECVEPDSLGDFDLVLFRVPKGSGSQDANSGIEHLRRLVLNAAAIPVIAFLGDPDRDMIREVIATGAYDYFVESASMPELRIVLRRAAQLHELSVELKRVEASTERIGFGNVLAADAKMLELTALARRFAQSDASIMITGETGTGKELLAAAIHDASPRKRYPFVAVACSALPETLIEAELFGHERGAFTGASQSRAGRFEAAGRGTIFLDEVGELSPSLQVKLLRVLQQCTFERLGSNRSIAMEARVICATNRNLKLLVRAGTFRADLYYRLNTIELTVPPLRERPDDIAPLAHTFLQRYAEAQSRPARRFGAATLSAMKCYTWPGNARELEHVVERAVVMCEGPEIRPEHLPAEVCSIAAEGIECNSFEYEVRRFKRRLLQQTLLQNENNKVRAARALNISRSSLHRLILELGIGSADAMPFEPAIQDSLPRNLPS